MVMRLLFVFVGLALVASAGPEFQPRQVVRAFDAITEAPVLPVERAAKVVKDGELVLGVFVGGKARAYPITQLTNPSREIINDRLGGVHLAATW